MKWYLLVAVLAAAVVAWRTWGGATTAPLPPANAPDVVAPLPPSPVVAPAAPVAPVAPREAPPAAAAPGELARDELFALQRAVGAGEIEVLVLRGSQPQRDARVRVWQRVGARFGVTTERGPALREGLTGADGRVLLRDFAGGEFVVRGDLDGRWLEAPATVAVAGGRSESRTVVLPFGDATITGAVRDEAGAPRAGVPVHVVGIGPTHGLTTVADASGRFEVGGLHGGRYHVQLEQDPDPAKWSAANERQLTLRTGERARMDFGGPAPSGSVRGAVVDAEGGPLRGERQLRLRHVEHNDERRIRTAASGEFTVPLPPGRWQVLAGDFAEDVLATVDVASGEARANVRWPGISVVAIVHAPPDVDAVAASSCFALSGRRGHLAPEGTFAVDGSLLAQWTDVPEGRYELWVGNGLFFVDAPNGVHVNVSAAGVQRLHVNVRR